MKGGSKKPEVAVILAGGYGKRLLPHTLHQPKPLLFVDGSPLIDSIFQALKNANVHQIIVVVGYLGHLLERYISESFSSDFEIKFARQKNIIGSADALSQAAVHLKKLKHDSYLVLASDYLLPNRYLKEFLDFHTSGPQQISISLRMIEPTRVRESSIVDIGPNEEISHIHEKPKDIKVNSTPIAGSLIYILPISSLDFIDNVVISERGEKELPEVINRMIASGMMVRGFVQEKLQDWEAKYREK